MIDNYNEIDGDLIKLAKEGYFDVIAHGCNCFCTMGAGIAPQMAEAFDAHLFELENDWHRGDMGKLGNIDFEYKTPVFVVNAYTQYGFGLNHDGGTEKPLDYQALILCMKKINHEFKGKHIGLPKIGCGLAGGDWKLVKEIIKTSLKDCNVTVVNYNKE